MKRDPYKNLRYCEKIKEKECFIQADGLQKKVRKFDAMRALEGGNSIDAEVKMREIQCFWKEGWDYNHTHHIYLEPKVTRPKFYLKNHNSSEINQNLKTFYANLTKFVSRMKADNEDETNYKIEVVEFKLKKNQNQTKKSQMEVQASQLVGSTQPITEAQIAEMSMKHLLSLFYEVSSSLISNFQKSLEKSVQFMTDVTLDPFQIEDIKNIHQQLTKWFEDSEEYEELFVEANRFQQLLMNTIKQSKNAKIFSAAICEQPILSNMSQIIHPLLIGIYSLFSQQMLVKIAKKKRGKGYADQYEDKLKLDGSLLQQQFKPKENETESMNDGPFLKLLKIMDNLRAQQERHSKILFVNLDGYQSEFNLQFVRNYHENIMYVSFPMFQKGEQNYNYNHRFNKKIMYNFTRSDLADMNILGMDINGSLQDIFSKDEILFNPQKYHEAVDRIYHIQNHISVDQNKNLYVFPINLPTMKSQIEISQKQKNISGYQSQFVKFIMRDQLNNAMKNYKPSIILLSYSGKLNLTNEHFLEIMQQLIKVQPKIVFFPNLTSALHERTQKNTFTRITQCIGKGVLHSPAFVTQQQRMAQQLIETIHYNPWEIDFFDKLGIFLKVSAGYYNLNRPFQQEGLQQKYKSSRVFKYISHIYSSLKSEYEHCHRRIQSNSLQVTRANLQNTIKLHSKEISKSVPEYYKRLFLNIKVLLQEGNTTNPEHRLLIDEVRDYYPSTYEQDQPYLVKWQQLQTAEELQLASAKYDEIAPIQLRESSRVQYLQKSQNKQSLIWLSFCYRDQNNQIVRIYKETSLLYKENQLKAAEFSMNIIIYNIFNATETQFMHCYAKPTLTKGTKFKRCKIAPIAFISKDGFINPNLNFKIWTDWSYTETNSHIVMYWPSQFDFISFYLHKLIGRKYEPKIMKCFYAAKKNSESMSQNQCPFYQINVDNNNDFIPRWGCSAINADDQIYFFGGTYSGERSYLNLQNDISTLDLTENNLVDFPQAKVFNLQKQLYQGQAFWGKLREKREVNSFVRPRADFQFYDRKELLIEQNDIMEDEGIRIIYAIGGFGEDFKTPYSLFVNYYYELKIQKSTRRLLSINKRNIPNKIIPVNIKSMIKNRGIYQIAKIVAAGEGESSQRDGMTSNLHYFHHRVAYAIQKQELNYRVKSIVAVQLYRNCKRDFIILSRRLGQARQNRDSEQQTVEIRKVEGNNHQILVEQGQQYYLYSLQLQVGNDFEEIPLMNQSIISIDSKKKMVCALIRHSQHTSNNCILASQTVKPINQTNQIVPHHEKHYSITLKKIAIFNENLNMHILLICNINQFAILHGLAFAGSKVKDYLIRMKKNKQGNNQLAKHQIPKEEVSRQEYSNITSFFLKKNNKITSVNIMQQTDDNQETDDCFYTLVLSTLDVARFSEGWRQIDRISGFAFINGKIVLKKLTFQARADNSSDPRNIILILTSSKKTYHLRLSKLLEGVSFVNVPELLEKNDIQLYKSIDCLPKILKNEELYEDMNYFQ